METQKHTTLIMLPEEEWDRIKNVDQEILELIRELTKKDLEVCLLKTSLPWSSWQPYELAAPNLTSWY